jgi:hypothetical protein
LEQLGCYGSLAPLPSAPSLVSERKKESERVGPNLVTPTGAEQRKAAGLFFFHAAHHQPPLPPPPRRPRESTPARQGTARGSRQQAASTGLALASGGGRAFALRRGSKGTEGRRREICLVVLCQKRHAHGGVAWRERIVGATSALPWDGPRIRGNSWNPRSAGWVVDRQWTGLGSEVFSEHTRTGEGEA